VANITRQYRRSLDAAVAGHAAAFSAQDVTEMELSFSRGFSPGWLGGCDHKMLVPGTSSAKRGVLGGEVQAVRGDRVVIRARKALAAGDGVVFAGNREDGEEQGGRVYAARAVGRGEVELEFRRGAIEFARLHRGQQIWQTDDPKLTARLRKSFTGTKPLRRVQLSIEVEAAVGARLQVRARAANGASCEVESEELLAAAEKHPLTHQVLKEQFGRLGGTVYDLQELRAEIAGKPMAPLSVLGKLRHVMIEQLKDSLIERVSRRTFTCSSELNRGPEEPTAEPGVDRREKGEAAATPRLRVLCRTLEQLEAALLFGVRDVVADFQDIRQYGAAVEIINRHRQSAVASEVSPTLLLATPRIQKPGELGIFRAMARQGADGYLVRNLAGLSFCGENGIPFVCDFSLNAANQWTVRLLKERGAERVTASYDLNRDQLLGLIEFVSADWLEVVVHQHMPMFHMEHCVFCAVLSPGTNKTNCGRPCDVHRVQLRDRVGMEHVLQADVGCRNTLYNAVPQSAAEVVPLLISRGLRDFRIELLEETAQQVRHVIGLYSELLAGRIGGKEVWQKLQASNRVGVTRGTMEERRNPLAIL
jgi:putative protease